MKNQHHALTAMLNTMADGVTICTTQGEIRYVNKALTEQAGYTEAELIGKTPAIFIAGQDRQKYRQQIEAMSLAKTVPKNSEYTVKHKDGSEMTFSVSFSYLESDGLQPPDIIVVSRDISAQKRAEEILHKQEEHFRLLYQNAPLAYQSLDKNGHILEVNQAWLDLLGYSLSEVIGRWFGEFLAASFVPLFRQQFPRFKAKGAVRDVEFEMVKKSDLSIIVSFNGRIGYDEQGNFKQTHCILQNITERKRIEQELRQRNRLLELLNRAGQAFSSTLDFDRVLDLILEEVRQLLGATAYSVWLTDPATGELVCRQATNPKSRYVRGWRLAPKQGLAGWVVSHNQSVIVADTRKDKRHFKEVDKFIKTEMRSIISVPLRVKEEVIGVLHVVDTAVDHFKAEDLTLLKPLANTAAIALENTMLYEQAQQDAKTKAMLLAEVNHRVKNNLTSIIGLLYIERKHAQEDEMAAHQTILSDMISRIQGLATVHHMLSAGGWAPLQVSRLAGQVIDAALQALPPHKFVTVDVTPSSVEVTPRLANSLSLIFNELTTNAVKYAWPNRETGQIVVSIKSTGNQIQLEFRDDGIGYPEDVLNSERHDVGWTLIKAIVQDGLEGDLSLCNDNGAMAAFRFPNAEQ